MSCKTYGLVLCESVDGWSLHEPGSSDGAILIGAAPYILIGCHPITQADYDQAKAWMDREDRLARQTD